MNIGIAKPSEIAKTLLDNAAGCTVSRINAKPITAKRGYWVGGRFSLMMSLDQPREATEAVVKAWIAFLPENVRHIGVWTNENKVYFDAVDLISNRNNALEVGTRRGELAIWDIRNACELPCKEG
jgi:hypothetical protein